MRRDLRTVPYHDLNIALHQVPATSQAWTEINRELLARERILEEEEIIAEDAAVAHTEAWAVVGECEECGGDLYSPHEEADAAVCVDDDCTTTVVE